MSDIEIEIKKWSDYQPRQDLKHPTWFRLQHGFIDSPDFYDFAAEEKLVWIMLLSLASRKSSGKFSFLAAYSERGCGISREALLNALEKLSHGGQITYRICTDAVRMPPRSRTESGPYITGHDKTLHNKTYIGLSENVAQKPKKAKPSPETLRVRATLKIAWLELFQKRFKHPYAGADSAFFNTSLKKIHETLGEKTLQAMIDYLAWNDPFIAKKGHPLHLLLANLHSLEAQKHRPETTMGIVARGRAQEKVLTESEQRLEEMLAYARRDNPGLLSNTTEQRALDTGRSESGGRIISINAEERVPEERSKLHGRGSQADTEAS